MGNNKLKCSKCGNEVSYGNKYCSNCGTVITAFDKEDEIVKEKKVPNANDGQAFNSSEYDEALFGRESLLIERLISNEMINNNVNSNDITLPVVEKKRTILTLIYSIILFIILTILFVYHNNFMILFLIFIITTFVYCFMIRKYSIKSYLKKEIKSRPDEKISYIVSSVLSGKVNKKFSNIIVRFLIVFIPIIIQLMIFWEPHIIYEKSDDGYSIRYYTIGVVKHDNELIIPSDYKGEKVVGIRGNVFQNVLSIEKVELPQTITEIRGEAFKGCINLKSINIPNGITEIKGSTFEGCSSLVSIDIPEGVTRIGGSAFRDCYNLKEVTIPNTVLEIGSSAFRNTAINSVCVSRSTHINERAFKGTYVRRYYYENGCVSEYGS